MNALKRLNQLKTHFTLPTQSSLNNELCVIKQCLWRLGCVVFEVGSSLGDSRQASVACYVLRYLRFQIRINDLDYLFAPNYIIQN